MYYIKVLIIAIFLLPFSTWTHWHTGYSLENWLNYRNPNWMSFVPDFLIIILFFFLKKPKNVFNLTDSGNKSRITNQKYFAYAVSKDANQVVACEVNTSTGHFETCKTAGKDLNSLVFLSIINNYLYIIKSSSQSIEKCSFENNSTLISSCEDEGAYSVDHDNEKMILNHSIILFLLIIILYYLEIIQFYKNQMMITI